MEGPVFAPGGRRACQELCFPSLAYSPWAWGGGDSEKHQPPFWKPGLWRLADIVVAESVSPLSASMLSGRVPVIGPGPALFQKPAHQCACAHLQWPSPYLCSEVDWFIAWSVAAVSLEALCSVAQPPHPAEQLSSIEAASLCRALASLGTDCEDQAGPCFWSDRIEACATTPGDSFF